MLIAHDSTLNSEYEKTTRQQQQCVLLRYMCVYKRKRIDKSISIFGYIWQCQSTLLTHVIETARQANNRSHRERVKPNWLDWYKDVWENLINLSIALVLHRCCRRLRYALFHIRTISINFYLLGCSGYLYSFAGCLGLAVGVLRVFQSSHTSLSSPSSPKSSCFLPYFDPLAMVCACVRICDK